MIVDHYYPPAGGNDPRSCKRRTSGTTGKAELSHMANWGGGGKLTAGPAQPVPAGQAGAVPAGNTASRSDAVRVRCYSPAPRCRAREAEDHLPPGQPGRYRGRRVWPEVPATIRAEGTRAAGTNWHGAFGGPTGQRTTPLLWLPREAHRSRGFLVCGVAPREAAAAPGDTAGEHIPPPEAPTAGYRLKEVTSAPKRVSTSASVLPKSGWSGRRESRSGLSRSMTHSS